MLVITSLKNIAVPFIAGILFLLISCSKTDDTITGKANIALVNAAYGSGPLHLASSAVNISSTPVNLGETSGIADSPYISTNAGLRNFTISNTTGAIYNANYHIGINRNYSLLVFDTLNASAAVKTLLVNDDLAVPDTGFAAVRFFNLSADAGIVNVSFNSPTNSVVLPNQLYAGAATADETWARFNRLDSGYYQVSVADTSVQLANTAVQLGDMKKYTFFIAGRRSDGSLRLYSYAHF